MRVKRDGACRAPVEYGHCWGGLDAHHIDTRGSGGDDVVENLITLCRKHHNLAHADVITKDRLRQHLTLLYGYTYE